MKIEFKEAKNAIWEASLKGEVIAKIVIENGINSWGLDEDENKVRAFDYTTDIPTKIPGSPFKTMNHAKAVIEYHFRNLTEDQS